MQSFLYLMINYCGPIKTRKQKKDGASRLKFRKHELIIYNLPLLKDLRKGHITTQGQSVIRPFYSGYSYRLICKVIKFSPSYFNGRLTPLYSACLPQFVRARHTLRPAMMKWSYDGLGLAIPQHLAYCKLSHGPLLGFPL